MSIWGRIREGVTELSWGSLFGLDDAPGHAEFWLAYSRLTALLRRVARCAEM